MTVATVSVRDFRCYEAATARLDPDLTVVVGPNGAGKTNLLEAIYFGCTGASVRSTNDRELVRFGAAATRVVVRFVASSGEHELALAFAPGEAKRMTFDGAPVERLLDAPERPLVSVFVPDRLGLVKGAPGARRAHIDQLVAALWPARAGVRRAYSAVLAQRNALLARIRAGHATVASLDAWDQQLAGLALELIETRRRAVGLLAEPFAETGTLLGLDGELAIRYRPRSRARDAAAFIQELSERLPADLERGFTAHGPHRDELSITRAGREVRTYGSQGQQRLALLALLLAERELIGELRGTPPLLLLDDVMSELDGTHRAALVDLLRSHPGQALITTTDLDHVPEASGVSRLGVAGGRLLQSTDTAAA